MEPSDLARWTRFAMKGGIGRCVAICDCVAENTDDLMFLKDDEIVVLLQVTDGVSEGVYLGYCEGVIGKFNSKNVRFTTKLKKPIMARRTSTASTSSLTSHAKSPTPPGSSSGLKSPTPTWGAATPPIPRTDSRASSSFGLGNTRTPLESPVVGSFPTSITGSSTGLGYPSSGPSSRVSSGSRRVESISNLEHLPSSSSPSLPTATTTDIPEITTTFSPSTSISATTANFSEARRTSGPSRVLVGSGRWTEDGGFSIASTSSPPATIPESPSTVSTSTSGTSLSTLPSSTSTLATTPSLTLLPPSFSNPDLAWNRASMTLERRIDLVQQQTAELEVIGFEGKEKPSPLTLEVGTWDGEDEGALTSPLRIAKKSPSVLSAKEGEDEVQEVEMKEGPNSTLDSANTTGTNPDSSYSNNSFSHTQRLSNASSDGEVGIGLSLLQDLLGGGGDSGSEDGDEETDRWSRSSGEVDRFKKDDASEEEDGTLEGLQYGEDEEEGEGVLDLGFPMPPSTMSVAGSQRSSVATTSTTTTSPPRPAQPVQQSPTSPTFSFTSFRTPPHGHPPDVLGAMGPIQPRERRPSLAPSHTSTTTTSSWEGYGDIYDNYRYSRFSMSSKVSGMSIGRRGSGASGVGGIVPPVPERVGRGSGGGGSVWEKGLGEVGGARKRADSDASVYTQGSGAGDVDGGADGGSVKSRGSVAQSHHQHQRSTSSAYSAVAAAQLDIQLETAETTSNADSNADSTAPHRPAPLELISSSHSPSSPLLHATWGSPMSSPNESAGMVTAVPGMGMVQVRGVSVTDGLRGSPTSPTFGGALGGGAAGMASTMRQRIEGERSPVAASFQDREQQRGGAENGDVSGLGDGIVVEDEDELPSRVLSGVDQDEEGEGDGDRTINAGDRNEEDDGEDGDNVVVLPSTPISAAAPPLPPSPGTAQGDSPVDGSPQPRPSHLRPSLRDLREGGTIQVPGTGERRSLFLPHPNAPKAPVVVSPGPMYVQTGHPPPPPHMMQPHPNGPYPPPPPGMYPGFGPPVRRPNAPFGHVIRAALTQPPPPPRPGMSGRPPRGPTIYGRLETELSASVGPVLVQWSLQPPPTKVMAKGPPVGQGGPLPGLNVANGGMGGPGVPPGGMPMGGMAMGGPGGVGAGQPPGMVIPGRASSMSGNGMVGGGGMSGPVGERASMGPGPRPQSQKRPSFGSVSLNERGASPSSEVSEGSKEGAVIGGGAVVTNGGPVGAATGAAEVKAPIPRPNFFPKSPGMRPRSRSFSDLKSAGAPAKSGLRSSLSGEIKKSSSLTGSSVTSSPSTSSLSAPTAKPIKSSPLRPSPLSLSQNAITNNSLKSKGSTPNLKTPGSPLAQSMFRSPSPAESNVPASTNGGGNGGPGSGLGFRKLVSKGAPGEPVRSSSTDSTTTPPTGPTGRPIPASRSTLPPTVSLPMLDVPTISGGIGVGGMPPPSPTTSIQSVPARLGGLGEENERPSIETRSLLVRSPPPMSSTSPVGTGSSAPPSANDAAGASGSGVQRQSSLRAKLSLPNLRRNRSRPADEPATPISTVDATQHDMLFQVQDMEFELVRPNFNHYAAAARSSEDSAILGRPDPPASILNSSTSSGGGSIVPSIVGPPESSASSIPSSAPSFLRAESPAMSINSLGGNRSPTIDAHHTSWISAGSGSGGLAPPSPSPYAAPRQVPAESETQMEAHRNRELKWMSLLSTSQPSQARKSKKIRKLLLDGVPSSVRYLVWSHLTDGKARCVPGVYTQLCKRGRVPVSEEMEKDVNAERGWFGAQDQLKVLAEAGGGVVQLLQAYLNMVPDIQYTLGLPHIVGQLLLLAPEEDAFWIFISIMDTHIRPYFSSGSTQLEVDSALFARALEVNDAAVAKKLLVDMGISPSLICAPWFSSLYVGCLPPEYLVRTWDLFLYDGIPFLIRVGLAIIAFVRRQVLECTSEEAVLAILHHPPASNLPPTPENYLSFVQSIKLKDDDVRKQRIKMEAQVKRQTQQGMARMGAGTTGSISLPRA